MRASAARLSGFVLCAALLGCAAARGPGLGTLDESEAAARKLTDAGDLRGAAAALRAAARQARDESGASHPRTLRLLGELAAVYQGLGQEARAGETLARMRAGAPETCESYAQIATTLVDLGRSDEARAVLKKAGALAAERAETYDRLGSLCGQLGMREEAARALDRAAELAPTDYALQMKRSINYRLLRRFDEARRIAEEARALCPSCADAYVQIGYAALDSGDDAAAYSAFQRAQELDPDDPRSYHHLAYSYAVRGDDDKAAAFYRRAIAAAQEKTPPDYMRLLQALTHLSAIYVREPRRQDEIEALYERSRAALAGIPEHPNLLNLAGMLALAAGRTDEAESYHRRALAILERRPDPEIEGALAGLAHLLGRRGRYAEAEALYQRALAEGRKNPGSHQYLQTLIGAARLYGSQRKFEPAERYYQEASGILARTPADPQYRALLDDLAGLYRTWGKPEAARLAEQMRPDRASLP